MTPERKSEIALKLFEFAIRKKVKTTLESFNRDLGNIAKESGVSVEELKSFVGPIVRSAIDEAFSPRSTVASIKPDHTYGE